MSLQFRAGAVVVLVCVQSACISISSHTAAPSAAPTAVAPLADAIAETRLLDQSSNAARLDALQGLLKKRGLTFSLQAFVNNARQRDGREQGQNVLLDAFGGDGPQIVLGAHLDAVPLSGGGHSHGMVDNGAGVVVVTRVAEALRARRLRHRIQVVFFDMEESGLQGSSFLAKSLDRANVHAMVNVDIAGYGDTIMSGPTTASNAPLHQAVARVCAARNYSCLRFGAFPNSDDRSFQAAGIPAISMAVLPALQAHQVWLLLNGGKESGLASGFTPAILRTIHTPDDTADKLTAEGMTLIYNVVLGLILELDSA
jgi:Zn-dependent M28 family amino/carboxypeptidase